MTGAGEDVGSVGTGKLRELGEKRGLRAVPLRGVRPRVSLVRGQALESPGGGAQGATLPPRPPAQGLLCLALPFLLQPALHPRSWKEKEETGKMGEGGVMTKMEGGGGEGGRGKKTS